MESAEIALRLIQGSHNIDRMRNEIKEVVGIISSYAKQRYPHRSTVKIFPKAMSRIHVAGTYGVQ